MQNYFHKVRLFNLRTLRIDGKRHYYYFLRILSQKNYETKLFKIIILFLIIDYLIINQNNLSNLTTITSIILRVILNRLFL
jgi:hypothetical protein